MVQVSLHPNKDRNLSLAIIHGEIQPKTSACSLFAISVRWFISQSQPDVLIIRRFALINVLTAQNNAVLQIARSMKL